MSRRRALRWLTAGVIGVALVTAPLYGPLRQASLLPVPAFAAQQCQTSPNHTEEFDWWNDFNDAGYGSSAAIQYRIAAFCNTSGDSANDSIEAYSMIRDHTTDLYAQMGARHALDANIAYIWNEWTYSGCTSQYGGGGGPGGAYNYCDSFGPPVYDGDSHSFFEVYDTCCGSRDIDMGYDGALFNVTQFDPEASGTNYWAGPWNHKYGGEAHNPGDEMPGRSPAHALFTSVSYYPNVDTSGGGGYAAYLPITSYAYQHSRTYYCGKYDGGAEFEIWTASTC